MLASAVRLMGPFQVLLPELLRSAPFPPTPVPARLRVSAAMLEPLPRSSMSKVAPLATIVSLAAPIAPNEAEESAWTVPAEMRRLPVNVLLPFKSTRPVPVLVSDPSPLIIPSSRVVPLLTMERLFPARATLPGRLKVPASVETVVFPLKLIVPA